MKKWNYYNDTDPKVCAWAKELIKAKLVPDGEVDCRSIEDVRPDEIKDFIQCHFFCGILGWSLALRLSGWPDDKPVWTGSCPCQPFSVAGKGAGIADERHLWPAFKWLIEQRRPPVVFGEQVASKDGREWLAGVRADLEDVGFTVGAADLCAAGVGAPHIRQRLYWMAHMQGSNPQRERAESRREQGGLANGGGLVQSDSARREPWESSAAPAGYRGAAESAGNAGGLGNAKSKRPKMWTHLHGEMRGEGFSQGCESSPWSSFDLIPCRDGKARRIESGSQPLVDGIPRGVVPVGDCSVQEAQATGEARVARLKGYGNAIVPSLAAEFIQACEEAINTIL